MTACTLGPRRSDGTAPGSRLEPNFSHFRIALLDVDHIPRRKWPQRHRCKYKWFPAVIRTHFQKSTCCVLTLPISPHPEQACRKIAQASARENATRGEQPQKPERKQPQTRLQMNFRNRGSSAAEKPKPRFQKISSPEELRRRRVSLIELRLRPQFSVGVRCH